MIQYAMLLTCASLVGALIYHYDMYDKEPPAMVVLALVIGATGMWLIGRVETWTLRFLCDQPPSNALLAVALISVVGRRHFNDPMDGLIYGSLVGLGAAVWESADYLGFAYPGASLLPPAEVVRIVGHPVMGGIGGYAVGVWRLRLKAARPRAGFALATALAIHFAWDLLAFSQPAHGGTPRWPAFAAAAVMLTGFIIYGRLVLAAADLAAKVFAPHSPRTHWGWPFR